MGRPSNLHEAGRDYGPDLTIASLSEICHYIEKYRKRKSEGTKMIFDGSEKLIGKGAQASVLQYHGFAFKVYNESYPAEWIAFENNSSWKKQFQQRQKRPLHYISRLSGRTSWTLAFQKMIFLKP